MELQFLNPQPAILRCSRCGRFLNWADARLQVVDGCRPHVDLPPVIIREAQSAERPAVLDLFRRDFGDTRLLEFGEIIVLDDEEVLVAERRGEIAGALAYRVTTDALHMLALATDPMWQRSGVGGHLVAEAELFARRLNIPRAVLATTNDNLPGLYFYQRQGYRITATAPRARVDSLPETAAGFAGIPVNVEIRLEKTLT